MCIKTMHLCDCISVMTVCLNMHGYGPSFEIPFARAGDYQAKLTLLSPSRVPLASSGPIHPQWVQVHVYNLSETLG